MRGISGGILIVTGIILLAEILGYYGVTQLIREKRWKRRTAMLYGATSTAVMALWLVAFWNPETIRRTTSYGFFYATIFIWTLNFFPKALVGFFVLLSLPFRLLENKAWHRTLLLSGVVLGLGVVLVLATGVVAGKKVLRVEKVGLSLPALPEGLNGLKIVQLSDIHLGSFGNDRFLWRIVDVVNGMKPDLVLFTGDMVNNYHQEIDRFKAPLEALHARYGKFAILGNHDYGDYTDWDSPEDKAGNARLIRQKIRDCGFRLLLNESAEVRRRDTCLYVVGVENWGRPPFPQYARLDSALRETPDQSFRILMTHDPVHWDDQVRLKTDIPLTLSGHTHGGQVGLKFAGLEFSFMCFVQKRWGGLYRENNQFLYVNRGIGCVGLPARIDMAPEITVFTLWRE